MSSLPLETQSIVDAKVSCLQAEVKEKVSRLQGDVNDKVSRLQAEVNEKIAHLQAELQEQVSVLETAFREERSRLNGPRNALSPVHHLPPEILSRILLESLAASSKLKRPSHINPFSRIHKVSRSYNHDSNDRYDFKAWSAACDTLRLCHVCQYWRTVALGFPQLWSHMQVKQSTQPEMLEFFIGNAKQAAFDLDLLGAPTANFKARNALSKLLDSSAGRLRSVALCCEENHFHGSEPDLFQRLSVPTAELESIQLVVMGDTVKEYLNLFPSGTPKLCCLEVRGIVLPWSAPILQSPHLTDLALHSTIQLNSSTMRAFISFLRHATQLEILHLDLAPQSTLTWNDVGGQPAAPVELPNIEILQIVSRFFAPLSIIMKIIQVEHSAHVALKVFCAESNRNLQAICDFATSGTEPEQVEIGHQKYGPMKGFVVSCESRRTYVYPVDDEEDTSLKPWADDLPWATFNSGDSFPFPAVPSTSEPRVPLSFSNLRLLVIRNLDGGRIPQAFWEELSGILTLEIILMKSTQVTVVAQFLKAMLTCDKPDHHRSSTLSATHHARERTVDVPYPFPALRALVFDALGPIVKGCAYDLRRAGYKIHGTWKHLPPIAVYLRFVASRLSCWRDYGGKRMLHLCFQAEEGILNMNKAGADKASQELFKEVDNETLRLVNEVSVYTVFGRTLVYANGEERSIEVSNADGEPISRTNEARTA